jgi:multiple sugar transport system substrate-binding protein
MSDRNSSTATPTGQGDRADGLTRRQTLQRAAGLGALALLPAGLLEACGGGSSSGGGGGGGGSISFWDMPWGEGKYESVAKGLVDQFNKKSKDSVSYRLLSWETYYETFQTAVSSGGTPDISTGGTYQGFQYDSSLADLSAVAEKWKKDGTAKDLIPGSLEAQYDSTGKLTGLPWNLDLRTYWYRKDLFEKAGITKLPTNLTEIGQAAEALTSGNQAGFGLSGDILGAQMLLTFFFTNGGGAYNAEGKADLTNKRNLEVVEWLQGLVKSGAIPQVGAGWENTDVIAAFERGEIAMMIEEPRVYEAMPDIADNTQMLSPPEGFHGDKGTIIWHSPVWLYESCQDKPAATSFIEWWLENQQPLWSEGQVSSLPARKSFYNTPKLKDPRVKQALNEYVPVGKLDSYPAPHPLPSLNAFEGQAFMQTLCQEIIGLKPAEDALNTANAALEEVIESTAAA